MAKSPAWQRSEGKNPEGGLNAKGRAAYNRANPGKPGLKAPQPEGGPRRDSFCARMKGMKRKLTSAKTANDPDSRINKSLRAWNCAEGGMIKKYAKGGGISTAMGKGKPVDLRMAQMDKYLKDPDMELVIGPTGKFQFRERKAPTSTAAPTPRPRVNPNAVAGAGTGDMTPRGGGSIPTPKVRRNPNAVAGAGTGDRTPRGGGNIPTPKVRPNPNSVAGGGSGDMTPRGGGIKTPARPRASRLPGASSGVPRPRALPLSAFDSKGDRQPARPLDVRTRVKPPVVKGRDDYSSPRAKRNMDTAKAILAAVAPAGLGRMAGMATAASSPPKLSKYAQALEANRKGSITAREAMEQMGMPYAGRGAPSRKAMNTRRALEALRGRNVTAEEAVDMTLGFKRGGITKAKPAKVNTVMREFKSGKLHSGKSKKIVKNPKQAVAIALSESRKASRRK